MSFENDFVPYGETPVEETVSLAPTIPAMNEATVSARAKRADFALADQSPGVDQLTKDFAQGNEKSVRETTAVRADVDFQKTKLALVSQVAAGGQIVSDEDVNRLTSLASVKKANPDTVIEDKFASNFVNYAILGDPANNLVYQTAFATVPDAVDQQATTAKGMISRKQQARNLYEELEHAYGQLGWTPQGTTGQTQTSKDGSVQQQSNVSKTEAWLKDMSVIYGWITRRNMVEAEPNGSGLPGKNELEQAQVLYLQDHDKFLPKLREVAGPDSDFFKRDPLGAMKFVQTVVGGTSSEALVNDVFAVGGIATGVTATAAAKLAGRVSRRVIKGAEVVAEEGVQTATQAVPQSMRATTDGYEAYVPAAMDNVWYLPEAAAKKFDGMKTGPDGKPVFYTDMANDVSVQGVSQRPDPGTVPVTVEKTQPHFEAGKKYTMNDDGTVSVDGSRTIDTFYISPAEKQAYEAGGRSHVASATPGKSVLYSDAANDITISPKTQPAEGLIPVSVTRKGDTTDIEIGEPITRINQQRETIKFGKTVVSEEEMQVRKSMADAVKSQASEDPIDQLALLGHHERATEIVAAQNITDKLGQVTRNADANEIRKIVPSIANPLNFFANSRSLTTERAQRLADTAIATNVSLLDSLVNPVRVERLTPEALDQAVKLVKSEVTARYNRPNDHIIDQVRTWDPHTNTYAVDTKFVRKDGTLFDTAKEAEVYRNLRLKMSGSQMSVEQEGNKFYLNHRTHIDETQSSVRDVLITSRNETPRGWMSGMVNMLTNGHSPSIRSSGHTTSAFQMDARTTATHVPSVMKQAIESASAELSKMGKWTKEEKAEFTRLLEFNRDYIDPVTQERGRFYTTSADFEQAFWLQTGKLPSDKQIAAYFNYTQLSDFDWFLRESGWMRDKARMGVRKYDIPSTVIDEVGLPAKVSTGWFDGAVRKNFDENNTQNANVYVFAENRYTDRFSLKDGSPRNKVVLDKLKSGEYTLIQVYDPKKMPLQKTTGINEPIHFAIVDNYKDRAIKWGENSDYRPGGHVIYQDQHYVKQARIGQGQNGKLTHFGDFTLEAYPTAKEAVEAAGRWETARKLLQSGDPGFGAYVTRNMPMTPAAFQKQFEGFGGQMSLENPILSTMSGRSTLQSGDDGGLLTGGQVSLQRQYPGLRDQFSSYDMSAGLDGKFLAERGAILNTSMNKGTEANPQWVQTPAKLYDPYTALQKGLAQSVRARWTADYKITAAESWIQEFGDLFTNTLPMDKLRQNPVYYLYHADGNLQLGNLKTQPERMSAALTSRKNIMQFIGAQDEFSGYMKGIELKLMSAMGDKVSRDLLYKTQDTMLPAIKDAATYYRGAAFHTSIGMFNPVHLWLQAQQAAIIGAIAPRAGFDGIGAAATMRMYRYTEDPAILADAAQKMSRIGWKKEHFLEAVEAWKQTGIHNVGSENAMLSGVTAPKLFQGVGSKFLDKGMVFFKAGESAVRDTAFFTAYSEWRRANPEKAFGNREVTELLKRSEDLTFNMTRASNASYNEGIMSIPAQFYTWNARYFEAMAGKTLTKGEKARALTAYAGLYGIPSTLGGLTLGAHIPGTDLGLNYQDIKEWALKQNINLSPAYMKGLMEGIPAMLGSMIGVDTNFGQRAGPDAGGIRDVLAGKKEAYEVIFGAGGATVGKGINMGRPFMYYLWNAATGTGDQFPLKMDDFKGIGEVFSTFSSTERMIVGIAYGQYFSRQQNFVDNEVTTMESVLMGLGVTPSRITDSFMKSSIMKDQKKTMEKTQKLVIEQFKLGQQAALKGDYQSMDDFYRRANVLAQVLPEELKVETFKMATRNNETFVDSIEQKWVQEHPKLQSVPALREYFERQK